MWGPKCNNSFFGVPIVTTHLKPVISLSLHFATESLSSLLGGWGEWERSGERLRSGEGNREMGWRVGVVRSWGLCLVVVWVAVPRCHGVWVGGPDHPAILEGGAIPAQLAAQGGWSADDDAPTRG